MGIVVGPTDWQAEAIDSYLVQIKSLGDQIPLGGYLICRNGGTAWIVAPNTSEVGRTWYCRDDAVTTATACTNSNTWFVPTLSQLQNPGYTCKTYWDSYSSASYWSSTEGYSHTAWRVSFVSSNTGNGCKTNTCCVRAFRCVTY